MDLSLSQTIKNTVHDLFEVSEIIKIWSTYVFFLKLHSYSHTKHIIFQEYYQRDCATWSFLLVQDLIIPDGKTICRYLVFDNCYFHFPLCINPCPLSIYQYPLLLTKNYNYKISLSLSYIWFFLVNILQWLL